MKRIIMISALAFIGVASYSQSNVEIANKFFEAYEAQDFDKMASYWHDSVRGQDVVYGDLFKTQDTYFGRETILSLWKEAFRIKPNYINIDIREQFTSGNFVVTDQLFETSTTRDGKVNVIHGEMITVFKFENGKIREQYDFGDYYAWDRQTKSAMNGIHNPERKEEKNLKIARDYIEAYSNKNAEGMAAYYADNVEFKDLTAKDAFGSTNFEHTGKEEVKSFWKSILVDSNPPYLNVQVDGAYYSGSYVMLNTTFSMVLPVSWTNGKDDVFVRIPIKTILQIKEDKILRHWDFADYNSYNEQIRVQKGR
ncbi:nuclear transport factor 2 family protein [Fulvivirga lutea]|uniref:Nuclear transport factor 2 family protein n=1 Tax=Fulvivirga lutea TaxID=2810512 RepID=A0A974WEG3_9BACT|nr:nuclear transport factor 2 family protein [Fulvivirga lutea]QSE96109.1 nuclear transport factor 2 family protein [Fulvivirga lutea]